MLKLFVKKNCYNLKWIGENCGRRQYSEIPIFRPYKKNEYRFVKSGVQLLCLTEEKETSRLLEFLSNRDSTVVETRSASIHF